MSKASAYFTVEDFKGKRDGKDIKKEIDKIPGVISVSVNNETARVAIDFDTTGVTQNELENKLKNLGFKASAEKLENHVM